MTTGNNPTPTPTPNQYEGTSNPPGGTVVTDTGLANPESTTDSTVPQTSATQPPSDPQTSQPQPQATAPQGQGGQPGQPGQPQPQGQGQPGQPQKDLSKAPQAQPPAAPPPQQNPAVQKAGVFHSIAEALAGGPQYKYSIDEYGNQQKQKVPVSNGHLALAIAMEALGGAITGLGVPGGPNATGRAAAAGYAAGQKQVKDQDQQAQQQATADYTRRVQTLETNMRMRSTAMQIGKMDAEQNDAYIGQYANVLKFLQDKAPGYIEGPVKYEDFGKYHVTQNNAIPAIKTPRLDSNGKQVKDANGVPQWDIMYYIVKPGLKMSGLFSPQDIADAKKYGYAWGDNDKVMDSPFDLMNYMNIKSQIAGLNTAGEYFKSEFGKIDKRNNPTTYKAGKQVNAPDQYGKLIDDAAQQYASTAGTTPEELGSYLRALGQQESSWNPKAVSETGASGLFQFTKSAAHDYGISEDDRFDPTKITPAAAHKFADLMAAYHDPKLAFAAYFSGSGAIKNGQIVDTKLHTAAQTQSYANQVSDLLGLQAQNIQKAPTDGINRMDMASWIAKNPQSKDAFQKFVAAVNATSEGQEGLWGPALAHVMQSDEQGGRSLAAFLSQGDPDTIRNHDSDIVTQIAQRKLDQQQAAKDAAAAAKTARDEQAQAGKVAQIDSLLGAKISPDFFTKSDDDMVKDLRSQGVTLTTDALIDARQIAAYKAPLATASNKRWYKDAKMDQGELLSIVHMMNPDFDSKNWDWLQGASRANSNQTKTIESASQTANHLNKMYQIINSQAGDKSAYPMMNKLLQEVGYQTGGDQRLSIEAMANILNGELGKTLSGGFSPDKAQLESITKTMNAANATQQMRKILGLYIDATYGKVQPLDDEFNKHSGASDQHLTIPTSVTKLFQQRGLETPWEKKQLAERERNTNPNNIPIPAGYSHVTDDGKLGFSIAQQKWVPLTQDQGAANGPLPSGSVTGKFRVN